MPILRLAQILVIDPATYRSMGHYRTPILRFPNLKDNGVFGADVDEVMRTWTWSWIWDATKGQRDGPWH